MKTTLKPAGSAGSCFVPSQWRTTDWVRKYGPRRGRDAGFFHERINPAEPRKRLAHKAAPVRLRADVGLDGDELLALRLRGLPAQRRGILGRGAVADIVDGNRAALRRQLQRHAPAKAAAGARD